MLMHHRATLHPREINMQVLNPDGQTPSGIVATRRLMATRCLAKLFALGTEWRIPNSIAPLRPKFAALANNHQLGKHVVLARTAEWRHGAVPGRSTRSGMLGMLGILAISA